MFRYSAFLFATAALVAQNAAVTVRVDVNANRHAINPLIYGVNYGDATTLGELNAPLNRLGGNNTTRYNWQLNADNRGQDWYFESIGDSSAVAGERGDTFFTTSKNAGAQPMITVPMIGWVAKLGANRNKLASFSVGKYGAQTGTDWQWYPDAGNGIWTNGQNVTANDPNDASTLVDSSFQQQWVYHFTSKFGTAANGGLKYYILDNEHSLWHSTHRDVHPTGATAAEIRDKVIDYAGRIKAADPSALVVGPEEWGWSGFLLSGYDQQYGGLHGWSNLPDRTTAMGGMDYLPWLLSQWKSTGKPVDIFSVHWYPQGGEFSDDTSSSMQLRRNRSTRSLWDPNYVDETWINDRVQLIPRLKNWVNTYYYAGTPVAVTEYNWGAESHINGATTQADVYGIFGREGLDLATRWTTPAASTPTYKAMKMYRNYDGNRAGFGDVSVSAAAPNPDNLSSFAAVRSSDGALTVMVISKVLSGTTPVTVDVTGFAGGSNAQVWQLTAANAITRLSDVALSGSLLTATVPAQSVTLFVVPASAGNRAPTALVTATPVTGTAPLAVSFDGRGSSDPDGTIASYAWSFGDGTSASGSTATHTYAAAGTYTATLTVTDDKGATGAASKVITVSAPPVTNACTVSYSVVNDWGNGFQAAMTVTNNGSAAINGWTVTWSWAGNQKITQFWNAKVTQKAKAVTMKNETWNPQIAGGATITGIGFNATYSGSNVRPTAFSLNGKACAVR